jgi:hypothetical protein
MRNAEEFRRGSGLKVIALVLDFVLQVLGLHRSRDDVLLAGPIAEIDDLAALATEGKELLVEDDFFLANGALHDRENGLS